MMPHAARCTSGAEARRSDSVSEDGAGVRSLMACGRVADERASTGGALRIFRRAPFDEGGMSFRRGDLPHPQTSA